MLESSIPVNQMKECIKLLSSLMRFQKNRKKIFSLKMDITVVRLLKRVLDLSEKDSDTVIISILQFIGVLVEEEFQTLSPNQQGGQDNEAEAKTKKNKIILQNCVENEGLLEVLLIVLQKYSLKEKLNWVKKFPRGHFNHFLIGCSQSSYLCARDFIP